MNYDGTHSSTQPVVVSTVTDRRNTTGAVPQTQRAMYINNSSRITNLPLRHVTQRSKPVKYKTV